jgi:hypothetical protein
MVINDSLVIVFNSGLFHAAMVKSRLYSPLRDKYGSLKVSKPDLGTQIRTSLRYLSLKHRCVFSIKLREAELCLRLQHPIGVSGNWLFFLDYFGIKNCETHYRGEELKFSS